MKNSYFRSQISNHKLGARIIFCLLPVALFLSACREKTAQAEAEAVSVRVKTVDLVSGESGVRYSANIVPQTQVELSFRVSGYVEGLMQKRGVDGKMRDLQEGDLVAKGSVLARLRQSDYAVKVEQAESQSAQAKASLESGQAQLADAEAAVGSSRAQQAEAEATLGKARLDFSRAQNLFGTQSMTKADFDASKTQFDAAEARFAASRSQLAMVEARVAAARAQLESSRAKVQGAQSAITEATIPLQDTSLRAPMNAVILEKSVEVGALVSPGKPGFVLADTSSVKAVFGAPDLALARLRLGEALTITTEALPGMKFRGQVSSIAPSADLKSRVFNIEVAIPNPRQTLKPGMIASLETPSLSPTRQSLVAPVSAIIRAPKQPGEYAVFVVEQKAGRPVARSRVVKLGDALGNTMVVLEGLREGEQVITSGTSLVLDGQEVRVIP